MSLWGSFSNSANAMMAQSTGLGLISQNIANMNTIGYKRLDGQFKTLLSERTAQTDMFSVNMTRRQLVNQSGVIQQTGNAYDLAMNGTGMFIINTSPTGSGGETLYTRNGSFLQQADAAGRSMLTTSDGYPVLGWAADAYGNFPLTGGTLTPVIVRDNTTMPGRATTTMEIAGNVDVRTTPSNASSSAVNQIHDMDLAWTDFGLGTYGVDFTVTGGTVTSPLPGFTAVDFTSPPLPTVPVDITWTNGDTTTVTVDMSTIALDGNGAPTTLTTPAPQPRDLAFDWVPTGTDAWDLRFSVSEGTVVAPLPGANPVSYDAGGNPTPPTIDVDIIWDTGEVESITVDLTTVTQPTTPAPEQMGIAVIDNNAAIQTMIFNWVPSGLNQWGLDFEVTNGTVTSPLPGTNTVTFDGAAQLTSTPDIPITITWTDGTTSTIDLDISQVTQYSGTTRMIRHEQDGLEAGDFYKSYFDDRGVCYFSYTNGLQRAAYKLPVANFPSENNLEARSGTLFAETEWSGEPAVVAIGEYGTGRLVPGATESSNVVLEDEFTRMLITQKAYSTAATAFKTTNEMTEAAAAMLR